MNLTCRKIYAALLPGALALLIQAPAFAASAVWSPAPLTGDWNTATNWIPPTVPNGSADTATFALSTGTAVSLSSNTEVNGITFTAAANAYTISPNGFNLIISGAGITNSSAVTQNFVLDGGEFFKKLSFINAATAGTASTAITIKGAMTASQFAGFTLFDNSATAGSAIFTTTGGMVFRSQGGTVQFYRTSTAGNALVTNNGGAGGDETSGSTTFADTSAAGAATIINNGNGGLTQFLFNSTADRATITNDAPDGTTVFFGGSTADNALIINNAPALTQFQGSSSAGNATIINNANLLPLRGGSQTAFFDTSTAGNATLICNAPPPCDGADCDYDGGRVSFLDNSDGGTARAIANHSEGGELSVEGAILFARGNEDPPPPPMGIGSIEGSGLFFVGRDLTVGSNNLSTTVSGTIQGHRSHSLTKIGTGVLTISGIDGVLTTSINGGALLASADGVFYPIEDTGGPYINVGGGAALTLEGGVTNDYIADSGSLGIVTGATVNLNYTGNPDKIASLTIDGIAQPPGLYGSAASGAPHQFPQFTGTGKLLIAGSPTSPLQNISTRALIRDGDSVAIGGFIIPAESSVRQVIIRGLGPSLPDYVAGKLSDPALSLYDSAPNAPPIATNDNWRSDQQAQIQATGLAPSNDNEAAIVYNVGPGSYTVHLSGSHGSSGVGLVEIYDLGAVPPTSSGAQGALIDPTGGTRVGLVNISTRGYVGTGDNLMIGGVIIGTNGSSPATIILARAIGPSMQAMMQSPVLSNPTLGLYNSNGEEIAFDNDWQQDPNASQIPQHLQPGDPRESALLRTLSPGNYTAIVRGDQNTTGIALVEFYYIPQD